MNALQKYLQNFSAWSENGDYSGAGIARVFSTVKKKVGELRRVTRKSVNSWREFNVNGFPLVDFFLIVVWTAPGFLDKNGRSQSDCGMTYDAMCQEFSEDDDVVVVEEKEADLFCGLLNNAMLEIWQKHKRSWGWIFSPHAHQLFTPNNLRGLAAGVGSNASVTGLAIPEIEESILKGGRIANTAGGWHIKRLLEVGGFDPIASHIRDMRVGPFLKGPNGELIPCHGVEEIIPLTKIVKKGWKIYSAKCIDQGRIIPPSTPEAKERQRIKMLGKGIRSEYFAQKAGGTLAEIAEGVIS